MDEAGPGTDVPFPAWAAGIQRQLLDVQAGIIGLDVKRDERVAELRAAVGDARSMTALSVSLLLAAVLVVAVTSVIGIRTIRAASELRCGS